MERWSWPVFPGIELWALKTAESVVVFYDVESAAGPVTKVPGDFELKRLRALGLALVFGEA